MSAQLSPARRRAILVVVALALMMVVSAVSGLNVALPDLARSTGASQTQLTWIVDAYTVVFAGLLLTAGALGDRYGRKGILVAGLVVFGAAAGVGVHHRRPRDADRRPGAHGRRRGRGHADDAVGDHHLLPAGGARPGGRASGSASPAAAR